jgi:hypothetical protein
LRGSEGLADARVGTPDSAVGLDERFDTILLLGNNLGLLAGERQGRRLLRRLVRVAADKGRILAGCWDPYDGASELSRRYQARNRERGRRAASNGSVSAIATMRLPGTTSSSRRARKWRR